MICSFGGYYIWSTYHPYITVQVSASSAGENLKIEAPHIVIADRAYKTADSVYDNLDNVVQQHEEMCQFVRDHYITSDIQLELVVKDNQTILNYSGSATTQQGDTVRVKEKKVCDFELDADIHYRKG